jgi:hypothetical protein
MGPPANGLELSRPAARASVDSFSHNSAGKARSDFPLASRVRSSELFGRPDPPLLARELGSNHDEPSTCHHSATSESTPAPTASPPGLSPQPGGRRSTRA